MKNQSITSFEHQSTQFAYAFPYPGTPGGAMATLAEAVQACTALTGASSAYLSSIAEAQSPPESRELTRDEVATLRAK